MPCRPSQRTACLAVALLIAFVFVTEAKVTVHDKGSKKPGPARAVKSDVKYIKCAVCDEIAKVLSREASGLRDEKGDKLKESDVLEKVEKVCDPSAEEGEWLVKHDLVEKGSSLTMKFMGEDVFGKCAVECKTMQKACEDIVSDRDTDIAEVLFTGGEDIKRAAFGQFLCHNDDESALNACSKKPPPLKKDRPKGPSFEAVDKKEIDMQRMMKQMEAMGMGGMQMYGRDDMAEMVSDYDDDMAEAMGGGDGGATDFGEQDFGSSQSFGSDEPTRSAVDSVTETVSNAWSGFKSFGSNLLSKAKTAVNGNEEDNVELR